MKEENTDFTEFLIEVSHRADLQEELQELREGKRDSFTGWNLTPDQLEVLRRGDPYEILAEVQQEHGDATLAIWVGGSRPIMVPVMPPPPGS